MALQKNDIVDVYVTATGAFIRDGSIVSVGESSLVVRPTSGQDVTIPLTDIVRNYSEQYRNNEARVKAQLHSILLGGGSWDDCLAWITKEFRGVVSSENLDAMKNSLSSDLANKISTMNAIRTGELK